MATKIRQKETKIAQISLLYNMYVETMLACIVGFSGLANLNMLIQMLGSKRSCYSYQIYTNKKKQKCTDYSFVRDIVTIFFTFMIMFSGF